MFTNTINIQINSEYSDIVNKNILLCLEITPTEIIYKITGSSNGCAVAGGRNVFRIKGGVEGETIVITSKLIGAHKKTNWEDPKTLTFNSERYIDFFFPCCTDFNHNGLVDYYYFTYRDQKYTLKITYVK